MENGQETYSQQTVEQAMQKCLTGDDLTSFLIRSACSNPSITYYLYWYLKVEVIIKFISKILPFFMCMITYCFNCLVCFYLNMTEYSLYNIYR